MCLRFLEHCTFCTVLATVLLSAAHRGEGGGKPTEIDSSKISWPKLGRPAVDGQVVMKSPSQDNVFLRYYSTRRVIRYYIRSLSPPGAAAIGASLTSTEQQPVGF